MTPNTTNERIQIIGDKIGGIGRYLEIGVAKGSTFFEVDAKEKHAVDPRFRFDPKERVDYTHEFYHPVSSDQYFDKNIGNCQSFDLIFLDGLHTYNQTLKDFLSSQALAHSGTIWLIDDTVPTDPIACEPDLEKVKNARCTIGNPEDQTWMGDVFKLVAFIDSYLPQYTCITTEGHGQTVVLPIQQTSQSKSRRLSTEDIERLNYVDLLLLKKTLLMPNSFEFILTNIERMKHNGN